jgi:CRP-like cAMP-binding protein
MDVSHCWSWAASLLSLLRSHTSPVLCDPEFDKLLDAALAVIVQRQQAIAGTGPAPAPAPEAELQQYGRIKKVGRPTSFLNRDNPSAMEVHRDHRRATSQWHAFCGVLKIRDSARSTPHCASINLDHPDLDSRTGFLPTNKLALRKAAHKIRGVHSADQRFRNLRANSGRVGSLKKESTTSAPGKPRQIQDPVLKSSQTASNTVLPAPCVEAADGTDSRTIESRQAEQRRMASKLANFETTRATELENSSSGSVVGCIEFVVDVFRFPGHHVIDPDDRHLEYWNLLMMLLVAYTSIVMPFSLGFEPDPDEGDQDFFMKTAFQKIISDFIEACFIIDVILTFVTGFHANVGDKVMDLSEIRWRYLRGWFAMDLLAAFPTAIFDITEAGSWNSYFKVFRIPSKLGRVVKMTHMKVSRNMGGWFADLNPSWVRLGKLTAVFIFVLHVAACVVGYVMKVEKMSVHMAELLKDEGDPDDFAVAWRGWTAGKQYSRVLVWCIAAIMGDVGLFGSPTTPTQVGICTVFILFGLIWISIVTGSAASLLANMDSSKQEHKDKVDAIKLYLHFRKVPKDITNQILEYFEYLHDSGKNYQETGNGGLPIIFDRLPDQLHVKLSLSLKLELVTLCPIFKAIDLRKGENKRAMLHMFDALVPSVGIPGQVLCEQGHFADRVYFLTRGAVRMVLSSTGTLVGDAFENVMEAVEKEKENQNRGLQRALSTKITKKKGKATTIMQDALGIDSTDPSERGNRDAEVGRYLSGGFFGHRALLERTVALRKHNANYVCEHYCEFEHLTDQHFHELIDQFDDFNRAFAHAAAVTQEQIDRVEWAKVQEAMAATMINAAARRHILHIKNKSKRDLARQELMKEQAAQLRIAMAYRRRLLGLRSGDTPNADQLARNIKVIRNIVSSRQQYLRSATAINMAVRRHLRVVRGRIQEKKPAPRSKFEVSLGIGSPRALSRGVGSAAHTVGSAAHTIGVDIGSAAHTLGSAAGSVGSAIIGGTAMVAKTTANITAGIATGLVQGAAQGAVAGYAKANHVTAENATIAGNADGDKSASANLPPLVRRAGPSLALAGTAQHQ